MNYSFLQTIMSATSGHSDTSLVSSVRGSHIIMTIAETGTVRYARRFWLERAAVAGKIVYALIILPMH
jgi:hypothetical protein